MTLLRFFLSYNRIPLILFTLFGLFFNLFFNTNILGINDNLALLGKLTYMDKHGHLSKLWFENTMTVINCGLGLTMSIFHVMAMSSILFNAKYRIVPVLGNLTRIRNVICPLLMIFLELTVFHNQRYTSNQMNKFSHQSQAQTIPTIIYGLAAVVLYASYDKYLMEIRQIFDYLTLSLRCSRGLSPLEEQTYICEAINLHACRETLVLEQKRRVDEDLKNLMRKENDRIRREREERLKQEEESLKRVEYVGSFFPDLMFFLKTVFGFRTLQPDDDNIPPHIREGIVKQREKLKTCAAKAMCCATRKRDASKSLLPACFQGISRAKINVCDLDDHNETTGWKPKCHESVKACRMEAPVARNTPETKPIIDKKPIIMAIKQGSTPPSSRKFIDKPMNTTTPKDQNTEGVDICSQMRQDAIKRHKEEIKNELANLPPECRKELECKEAEGEEIRLKELDKKEQECREAEAQREKERLERKAREARESKDKDDFDENDSSVSIFNELPRTDLMMNCEIKRVLDTDCQDLFQCKEVVIPPPVIQGICQDSSDKCATSQSSYTTNSSTGASGVNEASRACGVSGVCGISGTSGISGVSGVSGSSGRSKSPMAVSAAIKCPSGTPLGKPFGTVSQCNTPAMATRMKDIYCCGTSIYDEQQANRCCSTNNALSGSDGSNLRQMDGVEGSRPTMPQQQQQQKAGCCMRQQSTNNSINMSASMIQPVNSKLSNSCRCSTRLPVQIDVTQCKASSSTCGAQKSCAQAIPVQVTMSKARSPMQSPPPNRMASPCGRSLNACNRPPPPPPNSTSPPKMNMNNNACAQKSGNNCSDNTCSRIQSQGKANPCGDSTFCTKKQLPQAVNNNMQKINNNQNTCQKQSQSCNMSANPGTCNMRNATGGTSATLPIGQGASARGGACGYDEKKDFNTDQSPCRQNKGCLKPPTGGLSGGNEASILKKSGSIKIPITIESSTNGGSATAESTSRCKAALRGGSPNSLKCKVPTTSSALQTHKRCQSPMQLQAPINKQSILGHSAPTTLNNKLTETKREMMKSVTNIDDPKGQKLIHKEMDTVIEEILSSANSPGETKTMRETTVSKNIIREANKTIREESHNTREEIINFELNDHSPRNGLSHATNELQQRKNRLNLLRRFGDTRGADRNYVSEEKCIYGNLVGAPGTPEVQSEARQSRLSGYKLGLKGGAEKRGFSEQSIRAHPEEAYQVRKRASSTGSTTDDVRSLPKRKGENDDDSHANAIKKLKCQLARMTTADEIHRALEHIDVLETEALMAHLDKIKPAKSNPNRRTNANRMNVSPDMGYSALMGELRQVIRSYNSPPVAVVKAIDDLNKINGEIEKELRQKPNIYQNRDNKSYVNHFVFAALIRDLKQKLEEREDGLSRSDEDSGPETAEQRHQRIEVLRNELEQRKRRLGLAQQNSHKYHSSPNRYSEMERKMGQKQLDGGVSCPGKKLFVEKGFQSEISGNDAASHSISSQSTRTYDQDMELDSVCETGDQEYDEEADDQTMTTEESQVSIENSDSTISITSSRDARNFLKRATRGASKRSCPLSAIRSDKHLQKIQQLMAEAGNPASSLSSDSQYAGRRATNLSRMIDMMKFTKISSKIPQFSMTIKPQKNSRLSQDSDVTAVDAHEEASSSGQQRKKQRHFARGYGYVYPGNGQGLPSQVLCQQSKVGKPHHHSRNDVNSTKRSPIQQITCRLRPEWRKSALTGTNNMNGGNGDRPGNRKNKLSDDFAMAFVRGIPSPLKTPIATNKKTTKTTARVEPA